MEGFRSYLKYLEINNDIIKSNEEISPKYEAAALISQINYKTSKVAYLENIENFNIPIVSNLFGKRERITNILGIKNINRNYLDKINKPVNIRFQDQAVCQEKVYIENLNLLNLLPVLTHYEEDAGPYITAGILIAKAPDDNTWSMGVHRLQVENNQLKVFLVSPPLKYFMQKSDSLNVPLKVAVAIGVDPILLLASVFWAPDGTNKAEIAGALAGRSMKFTNAITVDIPVPVDAEFIIEGQIVPNLKETEGPFGEETGIYSTSKDSSIIKISAVTTRKSPIYQALVPFSGEGAMLMSIAFGIAYSKHIMEAFPQVRQLEVSPHDWTCVIVQINKSGRYLTKKIINYLFELSPYIKSVIVVDEDIDPQNITEVMWAVTTRCQPFEDVLIRDRLTGSAIDPSCKNDGTTSKIGFDATMSGQETSFRMIKFPIFAKEKANYILNNLVC